MVTNSQLSTFQAIALASEDTSAFVSVSVSEQKQNEKVQVVAYGLMHSEQAGSVSSDETKTHSEFCQILEPLVRVQLQVNVAGQVQVVISPTREERIAALDSRIGDTFEAGEVSEDQIQRITQVFTSVVCNQAYYGSALMTFREALGGPEIYLQKKESLDQQELQLSEPKKALLEKITTLFKGDLTIKLKATFDGMLEAFPDKEELLYKSLELGCKSSVIVHIEEIFGRVKDISRAYIGNLMS